jgi:hypothetical protein
MKDMLQRRYKIILAVVLGQLLSVNTAFAITAEDALARAKLFLPSSNVSLRHNGFQKWANRTCFHFEGSEGEQLSIDIDMESGTVRNYSWIRRQIQNQQILLTLPQAQEKAEEYVRNRLTLPMNNMALQEARLLKRGGAGNVYSFKWIEIKNDIEYPVLVAVDIGATSGEVVNLLNLDHEVTLASKTPKVDKESAIRLASENVKNNNLKLVSARLSISFPNPEQTLRWRIRMEGDDLTPYSAESGQYRVRKFAEVIINANDGRILNSHVGLLPNSPRVQIKPPVAQPSHYFNIDLWPDWTSDKGQTLYWKWLEMESANPMEKDRKFKDRSAIIHPRSSGTYSLIQFPDFIVHYPAYSPQSNRIAFEVWNGGAVYILDPRLGSLGRVNDPERVSRQMPSWDSTGTLLVMSGTHPGESDLEFDIWLSEINQKLSAVSTKWNKCIAALPGNDILPQFTPDNKWVIFAHLEASGKGTISQWSLYRVRPKSRLDKDYEPPQKIIDIPVEPERLSVFPDSNKVLVSYTGNDYEIKHAPEIIDITAKTRRPLKLPVLRDSDLPTGKPFIVREPVVSPDGKKIAFRALRWSGNPKDSGTICIYTCNLDGSGLKRITPPTATPMVPYKYPQAGVTALNAWEKLQPKQNLGQPMNREQEWKDAMKATGVREAPKPTPQTAEKPKAETPNPKTPKSQAPTASVP